MISLFKSKSKKKDRNFFDLSAKEKKRLIDKSAKGSNELQRDLEARYNRAFLHV
jgi:hypothetical protein